MSLIANSATRADQKPALWTKQFIILTLSSFLLFLNLQMLLSTFSMHIKSNLHGADIQVSLATSVFAATAIIARMLTGRWIKRWSKDAVLTAGLLVAGAATAMAALPSTVAPLLVIRAIYGLGFGIGSTIIPTLVSQIIPPARMGEGIGYFGLSTSLAMSFGPAIGMSMMKEAGFTTLAIVGAGAVLCMFPMLLLSGAYKLKLFGRKGISDGLANARTAASHTAKEQPSKAQAVEAQGAEVQAANAQAADAQTPEAPSAKVSATKTASKPRSIWRFAIIFPASLNVLLSVTYSGILSFIAVYGEELQLAQVGLFFMFNAAALLVVRPFAGKLFDRKGPLLVLVPAAISVIISVIILSYTSSMLILFISAIFYGIGFGSIQPTVQAWMLRSSTKEEYAAVNGIFYNSTDVGVSIGAILLGVIASLTNYGMMYRLSSLFMVLFVAAILLFIRKTKMTSQSSAIINM